MASFRDPVTFSQCSGPNVTTEGSIARGHYRVAQGQFMLKNSLQVGQTLYLKLTGCGVLRISACSSEQEATKWMQSNKPLPKENCMRIRMPLSAKGHRNFMILCRSGDIELSRAKSKSCHISTGSDSPTLTFDIECGNMTVELNKHDVAQGVRFNTKMCGRHVRITDNSAKLVHFNPSALCITAYPIIERGEIYRLTAKRDTGKSICYLRLGLVDICPSGDVIYGRPEFPSVRQQTDVILAEKDELTLMVKSGCLGVEISSLQGTLHGKILTDMKVKYFLCMELHNVEASLRREDSSRLLHAPISDLSETCSRESYHQTSVKRVDPDNQDSGQRRFSSQQICPQVLSKSRSNDLSHNDLEGNLRSLSVSDKGNSEKLNIPHQGTSCLSDEDNQSILGGH